MRCFRLRIHGKPDGYKKTTYTIGGQTADVLMSEDGSYCLFYGVSSLGVTGWFRYDCNDNTIQVYSVMSAPAANLTTQTESQGVSAASDRMWKVSGTGAFGSCGSLYHCDCNACSEAFKE